jgi:hypothetical protein
MRPSSHLTDQVTSKIISFGESSYGAYTVALVMADGTIVDDVTVAWGREVVKVAGVDVPDFDGSQVVDALDRGPRPRG